MPITLDVASPINIPTAATTQGTPVTTTTPAQEALAVIEVPDIPAIMMSPALTTPAAQTLQL